MAGKAERVATTGHCNGGLRNFDRRWRRLRRSPVDSVLPFRPGECDWYGVLIGPVSKMKLRWILNRFFTGLSPSEMLKRISSSVMIAALLMNCRDFSGVASSSTNQAASIYPG